jgi:hypothetical protein
MGLVAKYISSYIGYSLFFKCENINIHTFETILSASASDPDPQDPYVCLWISHIRIRNYSYGFGSESFHHNQNNLEKPVFLQF